MPDAEIVMADSDSEVFSKTQAVNNAAAQANGRLFVVLDSDCYMRGSVIAHCATAIEEAARRDHPLWFIPYRHLYRLTEPATEPVLHSDPQTPYRFHNPPSDNDVVRMVANTFGHRFGAMIQIMPREAFEAVGGMDVRFSGWGGEDVAFVRALDTLWGKHKTTDNEIFHLWHPTVGDTYTSRMWAGQERPLSNNPLASRYHLATGDRVRMRNLVEEARFPDVS